MRLFLVLAAIGLGPAAVAAGCSGDIVTPSSDSLDGGSGGAHDGGTTTGPTSTGIWDALPDYVDPGCPDAGPAKTMFQCDPYNQFNGDCGPGEGCDIFVEYPTEPCGQEIYGSVCVQAGPGKQGDDCGGPQDCQGGFVCVVSGSGNQCVQLCELSGNDGCPAGLVCEPIDVQGFGGCL